MKVCQKAAYILGAIFIGIGIGLGIDRVKERKINREAKRIERESR